MPPPVARARDAVEPSVASDSIEALLDFLFNNNTAKQVPGSAAKPNPIASAGTPGVLNAVCHRGKELLNRAPTSSAEAAAKREQRPYLFFGRSILEHARNAYPAYTLLGSAPSLSELPKSGRVYLRMNAGPSVLVLGRPGSGKTETLRRLVEGCNLGLHPFGSGQTGDSRVGRQVAGGTRTLVISRAAHPSYHANGTSAADAWCQPADFTDLADTSNPDRATADLSIIVFVPPVAYGASLRIYNCHGQQPPDGRKRVNVFPLIFDVRDLAPIHIAALMGIDGLKSRSEALYEHVFHLLRVAASVDGIGGANLRRSGWNYRGFRSSLHNLVASLKDESQRELLEESMEFMDCHLEQELDSDEHNSGAPSLESIAKLLTKGGNRLAILDLRHPLVNAKTAELLATVAILLWQHQAMDEIAVQPTPSALVLDDLDVYFRDVAILPVVDPLRISGRVSTFVSFRDIKKLPNRMLRACSCIVVHASAMEPTVPTLIQKLHLTRTTSGALLEASALRPGEAIMCCGNSKLYMHEDDRRLGRLRVCKILLRETVTGQRAVSEDKAQQEKTETSRRRSAGGPGIAS